MNSLNRPEFLLNNKTFQTIYGRNLLHELNIIIPNETLIVTMEDLWDDFSNFFTKNVQVLASLQPEHVRRHYEKVDVPTRQTHFEPNLLAARQSSVLDPGRHQPPPTGGLPEVQCLGTHDPQKTYP